MKKILTGLIILPLMACVTSEASETTDGNETTFQDAVTSVKISDTRYAIRSVGNAHTHRWLVRDYALLKAAKLCKAKQFSIFVVTDGAHYRKMVGDTTSKMPLVTRCWGGYFGGEKLCAVKIGGTTTLIQSGSSHRSEMSVDFLPKGEKIPPFAGYDCNRLYRHLQHLERVNAREAELRKMDKRVREAKSDEADTKNRERKRFVKSKKDTLAAISRGIDETKKLLAEINTLESDMRRNTEEISAGGMDFS